MSKSLKRQRILFERQLQRLVAEGIYVADNASNSYRLTEPFPQRDWYSDYLRKQAKEAKKNKRKMAAEANQGLDEVLITDESQSNPKPDLMEFDEDYPNWKI